jgi:hypothetical protein
MNNIYVSSGEIAALANDGKGVFENISQGLDSLGRGDAVAALGILQAVASNLVENSLLKTIATEAIGPVAGIQIGVEYTNLQSAIASNNTDKIVEALLGMTGAMGGLIASLPSPQTRAVGILIATSSAAAKELYKNREPIKDFIDQRVRDFVEAPDRPWPYDPKEISDDFKTRYPGAGGPNSRIPIKLPSYWDKVDPICRRDFETGLQWVLPRDPLILDLDDDGVELTTSNSAILFDNNADGIKTGTQWAKADDGILVRDLNGNGTIDSGRELFGDQTLLANGQTATNGFQALADLDSNHDGTFDSSDAAYTTLQVWRDLNQDGISQANELQGLSDAGIASINLTANAQGQSSFTKTAIDGSTTTQAVNNINFATNNFYSDFTDDPVVSETVAALPQMQGAGQVRDMREAMSLGTSQSAALQSAINTFKSTTTTQDRQSLVR